MRRFGDIALIDGSWSIQCEPQVAMRLKRVFPKLNRRAGTIVLSDTAENGRELSWFLQRYPMRIDMADAAHMESREATHKALTADIGRILSNDYRPREFKLGLPPREYQRMAADLALRTRGLLIADDVGLGKTCTAICAIADPSARPALVVTLTHLPRQWKAELERFIPGIRVHILKTGTPYPLERAPGQTDIFDGGLPDVIISNYHKLLRWADEFTGLVRTVVFDEAHELRRPDSAKYQAAKQIASKADLRIGLTATPIFNYGSEIFSVMQIIQPDGLGSRPEFSQEWCDGGETVGDPKALGAMMREHGLMIRRTRTDVGRELPGLTTVPHQIDVDLSEINKVATPAMELARVILAQGGMGIDKMRAAEELSWRLRQATGIAKAVFVADFVRLLVENGEKVVLYGWHHEVYAIWRERLANLRPVFFTGEESIPEKERSKAAFVDGDSSVLIMSLRAGAGLDGLQKACRTVVFGEIDWSPGVHEQAIGRIYRDGQTDPVIAYFLLADSGSDPVVSDVLGVKREQLEGIRDPEATLIQRSQIDPDRMRKLAEDFLRQRGAKREDDEAAA